MLSPLPKSFLLQCLADMKPLGAIRLWTAGSWCQWRAWVRLRGLFLKMPVTWEVTHLLISAAPESSENQKCMALGCPARIAEQKKTEQDVWPAAGGSLRAPSFSPWTIRPLLPSHLALLTVVACPFHWGS